jgi:hypothetical protein
LRPEASELTRLTAHKRGGTPPSADSATVPPCGQSVHTCMPASRNEAGRQTVASFRSAGLYHNYVTSPADPISPSPSLSRQPLRPTLPRKAGGSRPVAEACLLLRPPIQPRVSRPAVYSFNCPLGLAVTVPGYRSRGLGSISGATRFSEK